MEILPGRLTEDVWEGENYWVGENVLDFGWGTGRLGGMAARDKGPMVRRWWLILVGVLLPPLVVLGVYLAQPVPHRLGVVDGGGEARMRDVMRWIEAPDVRVESSEKFTGDRYAIITIEFRGYRFVAGLEHPNRSELMSPFRGGLMAWFADPEAVTYTRSMGNFRSHLATYDRSEACKEAAEELLTRIHARVLEKGNITYRQRWEEYAEGLEMVARRKGSEWYEWVRMKVKGIPWVGGLVP